MYTGKQLADFCKQVYAVGWVYWYGTYGKKCSQSLYESKKRQYPSHYASDRTSGYMREIKDGKWCADCVGMIKGFFWKNADITKEPKYASNNCPDVSANGMIKLCKETGAISTIPDEPGLVVWKDGHIGVYIGSGYTIEMRGFAYDCVKRKVTAGPWTKWGRLPASMISYGDKEPEQDNVLKVGSKGDAVKELQEDLLALGYALPKYGADGDFGSETQSAVKRFQSDFGLPVTGIADAQTMAMMETVIERMKAPAPAEKWVEITGGSVNVRNGPGTADTQVIGYLHRGGKVPYQGVEKEVSGRTWYSIDYDGKDGWVSSKYSKLVD